MKFTLSTRRQDITRFLVRYELFKLALNVHGAIIECGVGDGGGLFAWYHFSSIFEPYAHPRRVLGFDTFAGFPTVSDKDSHHEPGEQAYDSANDILTLLAEHDANRPISHIPRLQLIKGDATITIPQYIQDNPHLVVAIAYMDFDIYAPTKTALDCFLPRMPKGSLLAFDEVGIKNWPGETIALLESLDIRHVKLERFEWQSTVSYCIL